MIPRPPGRTLTDTLCPYTALLRSPPRGVGVPPRLRSWLLRNSQHERGRSSVRCTQTPDIFPPINRGAPAAGSGWPTRPDHAPRLPAARSEEHTSELQSLMRISYAVFCLKKKKHTK